MLATISSAALQGIDAELVHVEVNSNESGDPKLILVGLPDAAVKESDDRVVSALSNSGFKIPRTRTTINLAPGHLRKEGPFYDLPIAIGILVATEQLESGQLDDYLIAGELSLSGATRPVRGALALARLAKQLGKRGVLLPPASADEAALVDGVAAYPVQSLDQAFRFLKGEIDLQPVPHSAGIAIQNGPDMSVGDFAEIKGQHALRRAIEVSAAGGHNLIMKWSNYLWPLYTLKLWLRKKRNPLLSPTPTFGFLDLNKPRATVSGVKLKRLRIGRVRTVTSSKTSSLRTVVSRPTTRRTLKAV